MVHVELGGSVELPVRLYDEMTAVTAAPLKTCRGPNTCRVLGDGEHLQSPDSIYCHFLSLLPLVWVCWRPPPEDSESIGVL